MSAVSIKINADGAQFHRVMAGVEHRLHGLKEFVGFGFKEQLAGLVGAATIVEATKNMMEFAHATKTAADNMGITVAKTLQLQAITRNHGTDLGLYASAVAALPKMRADALRGQTKGDKKLAANFHALGITDAELKKGVAGGDLGMVERMIVNPPKGMSNEDQKAKLSGLFGGDAASKMVAQKSDLSHKEDFGVKVSAENIERLSEANVELQNFADLVRSVLIPVLLEFADFIKEKFGKVTEKLEISSTKLEVMRHSADIQGHSPGRIKELAFQGGFAVMKAGGWLMNKVGLNPDYEKTIAHRADVNNEYLYGAKAVAEGKEAESIAKEEIKTRNDEYAKRAEDRRKDLEKNQKDLDKATAVSPSARIEGKDKAFKNPLSSELKANNPFLKIGGLMGTSDYRLERLQIKANSYLELIAKKAQQDMQDSELNREPDAYSLG